MSNEIIRKRRIGRLAAIFLNGCAILSKSVEAMNTMFAGALKASSYLAGRPRKWVSESKQLS